MTEGVDEAANSLLNGTKEQAGSAKPVTTDVIKFEHSESPDLTGGGDESSSVIRNGQQFQPKEKCKDQNVKKVVKKIGTSKDGGKSSTAPVAKKPGVVSDMGCTNTRAVIEPSKIQGKSVKKEGNKQLSGDQSEAMISSGNDTVVQSVPNKENEQVEVPVEVQATVVSNSSAGDNVFCDQVVPGTRDIAVAADSSDSSVNRSRNASRTSESTNSDTEKAVQPNESASESTERVVRYDDAGDASSDISDIEETVDDKNRESEDTPDDGNRESSSIESGSQNRPHSLSLPKPLQYYERQRHMGSKVVLPDETSSDEVSADSDISSLGSSLHGTILRKGDMIEFVADNLQEKIRGSKDSSSMGSRTSSMRSISSVNSISSYTSSMATSVSGMSRSPSSLVQQSPEDIPPIDPQAVMDLEVQARVVADMVDLMMGNLKSNLYKANVVADRVDLMMGSLKFILYKMSSITVGTLDAYKHSVDNTCDAVDASIKAMYALMAKCEELSKTVKPVYQLADQIKEIKRLLDLFESQLDAKTT